MTVLISESSLTVDLNGENNSTIENKTFGLNLQNEFSSSNISIFGVLY